MSIIPLIFIIIRRVHFEEKGINLFISAANKASALLIFLWSSFSTPPTLHALDTLRKHLKLTNKNVFSSLFGAVPENWKNEICHQAKNWISSRVSIRVCWPYSTLPPQVSDTKEDGNWFLSSFPSLGRLYLRTLESGKRRWRLPREYSRVLCPSPSVTNLWIMAGNPTRKEWQNNRNLISFQSPEYFLMTWNRKKKIENWWLCIVAWKWDLSGLRHVDCYRDLISDRSRELKIKVQVVCWLQLNFFTFCASAFGA